jgi:hypothetical protein
MPSVALPLTIVGIHERYDVLQILPLEPELT